MDHKVYILNAISLNLIGNNNSKVDFLMARSSMEEAKMWASGKEVISVVRHGLQFIAEEIARECYLFEEKSEVKFGKGAHDVIVVQYRGPRLPEGAARLPKEGKLEIWEGIIRVY